MAFLLTALFAASAFTTPKEAPDSNGVSGLNSFLTERLEFRVAPGCNSCHLYTDFEDSNTFTLIQQWASQAELDRYLASDACKTLIAGIELSAVPLVIQFDSVAQRGGTEVIEAARRAQGLMYPWKL